MPPQEILEKIILASPLVDIERTKREARNSTPTKVFLKSASRRGVNGIQTKSNVRDCQHLAQADGGLGAYDLASTFLRHVAYIGPYVR